ncbi:HEAT repeat domain-containing protein [Armatimonas rosea]|nr:HEAT repeat domain-containing protein [Armatimonas rosea]
MVKNWIERCRHWNPFISVRALEAARSAVRRARQRASDDDLSPLVALLDFPDEWIVGEAARGISKLGGEEAVGALITHLENPEPLNVAKVAWALGRLRAPEAVEVLRKHARRGVPDAVRSLGLIGDNAAVPTLVALLESGLVVGKDSPLLKEIFQALRRLPDIRALPVLTRYWTIYGEIAKQRYDVWGQKDAEELVLVLGEVGDECVLAELERIHSEFV